MNKFYFAAALAAACTIQASAQNYANKLETNQVYYLTNDSVTVKEVSYEDENTGETGTKMQETFWMGSSLSPAYKALNMPLDGTSSTKKNFLVRTRKDYTDPETGFSMPAGYYRGIFVDATISLCNYDASENYMVGFQNLKSVILYFAPQPLYQEITSWSIYNDDYPTGRVQARYMKLEDTGETVGGTAISNQAYRETHIDMKKDTTIVDETHTIVSAGTKTCGYTRDASDYRKSTIDQVYKLKVNLNNAKDGKDYENIFAKDSGDDWVKYNGVKKSEFDNLICDSVGYSSEMDYYFADLATTRPYTKSETFSSCATGYDCYADKWGTKLEWTPETIIQIQIKKRLYLVGYALICGTDGAKTVYMNASDGKKAAWAESGQAYGTYAAYAEGIENVAANASSDARVYNLAGQRANSQKGLNIQAGKVIFVK